MHPPIRVRPTSLCAIISTGEVYFRLAARAHAFSRAPSFSRHHSRQSRHHRAPSTFRLSLLSAHDNMPAISHPLPDGNCYVLTVDIDSLSAPLRYTTPLLALPHALLYTSAHCCPCHIGTVGKLLSTSNNSSYLFVPGRYRRLTTVVRYSTRSERRHNAFHRSRFQYQRS